MKSLLILIYSLFTMIIISTHVSANEKNIITTLQNKNFAQMDEQLNKLQNAFEAGSKSEFEIRDAFRPFFYEKRTPLLENLLVEWTKNSPNSYAAHLAFGIFLLNAGLDARGGKYISETPEENIKEMQRLLEHSKSELKTSLKLTKRPYMSIFNLQLIAMYQGDPTASKLLIEEANKILPNNRLARARHQTTLTPRFGGSNEQMLHFINYSEKEGVDRQGILQLEAIMFDDMGRVAESEKDYVNARKNFLEALTRGNQVEDARFTKVYLEYSLYYICKTSKEPEYCM